MHKWFNLNKVYLKFNDDIKLILLLNDNFTMIFDELNE